MNVISTSGGKIYNKNFPYFYFFEIFPHNKLFLLIHIFIFFISTVDCEKFGWFNSTIIFIRASVVFIYKSLSIKGINFILIKKLNKFPVYNV